MTFTIEVADSAKLSQVLGTVSRIDGVRSARRK
jgi:GTP pyrophosphokinase